MTVKRPDASLTAGRAPEAGKPRPLLRRFLIPAPLVTLICFAKFGARVSPRAEVELGPELFLGRGVNISSFCKVKVGGPLRIGPDTHIATGSFIDATEAGLEIGENCLIGPHNVILTSSYHYARTGVPLRLQGHHFEPTRIGRNVFLGAHCVVLAGTVIEDDVIVAAHSVVSGRVPAGTVVSGNPARPVFRRR
jgi:Acetyltransferase (isoleucine patch superfamily)